MTTGRINQVTARAISPLQLGKGLTRARPIVSQILRQKAGHRSPKGKAFRCEPWPALPRFIQYSSRTLHVPTGHVAPPRMVSHAPTDTANFRRAPLFPITLGNTHFRFASPGRKDLPRETVNHPRGLLACPCEVLCRSACRKAYRMYNVYNLPSRLQPTSPLQ